MQEWRWMTAAALGRGIAAGEIDPVALTETYLAAIDSHEHRDRIYARVTPERARSEAKAAAQRAKAGRRLSLLDGVPVSWKDLFDTAGTVTEAGSNLLKDRVPDQDALVLKYATAAGLVCLGKTHMSELAFSGLGHNPSTGTPPCVNDEAAAPGGSSSGAGASVAYGLAAAGIGSDTGGSVRIPAAWNDLVGLKTTHGRLSLEGVVPLAARFDTVGPLCRSVEDAALLLAVLEDSKPVDLAGADLEGRRFAVLGTLAMDDLSGAPADGFQSAIERLQATGAVVDRIEVPAVEAAMAMASCLFTTEAYGQWRDVIEANPDRMYHEILERFRLGGTYSGADYVGSWIKLDALRKEYAKAVAGYDAVLMPTSPILPPNLARMDSDSGYYKTANVLALRNTRIGNMMGLCALTLPVGVPSCGLMMCALPQHDARLLRLGIAAEEALG